MTGTDVLREVRRLLGEALVTLGDAAPVYSDAFIVEYLEGAALHGEAVSIFTDEFLVSVDSDDAVIITPEPANIDGLLLAAIAVSQIVSGDFVGQVKEGELGVSFSTGLESISTIEASRKISEAVQRTADRVRYLTMQKLSKRGQFSTRVQ